jgi:hypothetical protein
MPNAFSCFYKNHTHTIQIVKAHGVSAPKYQFYMYGALHRTRVGGARPSQIALTVVVDCEPYCEAQRSFHVKRCCKRTAVELYAKVAPASSRDAAQYLHGAEWLAEVNIPVREPDGRARRNPTMPSPGPRVTLSFYTIL